MLHLACHEHFVDFDGVYMLAKGAGIVAIPAALVVFGWVRKARNDKLAHVRTARGECSYCGYPLGVHDKCTECGADVNRFQV